MKTYFTQGGDPKREGRGTVELPPSFLTYTNVFDSAAAVGGEFVQFVAFTFTPRRGMLLENVHLSAVRSAAAGAKSAPLCSTISIAQSGNTIVTPIGTLPLAYSFGSGGNLFDTAFFNFPPGTSPQVPRVKLNPVQAAQVQLSAEFVGACVAGDTTQFWLVLQWKDSPF